jgi:hypothetical protein
VGTSSNGPESSIKIELGSKEAESYYNRKDNSINNDYCQQVNIYDDVEEFRKHEQWLIVYLFE